MRPFVKNLLKAGLALTAVEATARTGIWKDTDSAEQGYQDTKHTVLGTVLPPLKPYLEKVPFPEFQLPKIDFVEYWNRGVISTFSFLDTLPGRSSALVGSAWSKIREVAAK